MFRYNIYCVGPTNIIKYGFKTYLGTFKNNLHHLKESLKNNLVIFASLFGLNFCLISRVRPVHSFFEKEFTLENPLQIFTNLFFHAYLRNLFGLYLFSHQSCATGTLLLRKQIYPRKSSLNLSQLIFFMLLGDVQKVLWRVFADYCGRMCGIVVFLEDSL